MPGAVFVSARTGEGIEELRARIAETLPDPEVEVTAVVPYDRGELVSLVHERGRVLSTDYEEEGTRVHALVNSSLAAQLEPFTSRSAATAVR